MPIEKVRGMKSRAGLRVPVVVTLLFLAMQVVSARFVVTNS